MRILTRYILIEVVKFFALGLFTLTLVVVFGLGIKEGLRQGLPAPVIVRAMFYMLPETLGITSPVAMLLSVCAVYGRIAGSNELVALKAAGINPVAIVWPVLALASGISLATVWVYDISATWGRPNVKRVVIESAEQIAYGALRMTRAYTSPKFSIAVKKVVGQRLIQPTIILRGGAHAQEVCLKAKEAELETLDDEGTLRFRIWNGSVDADEQMRLTFGDTIVHEVALEKPKIPLHRDWLSMREIPAKLDELASQAEQQELELISLPGDDGAEAEELRKKLEHTRWKFARISTEPYRRWANGFSCFCFVLIGIPVSLRYRFDSFLASFFACFLPILGVYYPLLMLQEDLTTSGTLHPAFFWLGNLVLIAAGLYFVRRVIRH